MTSVVSQQLYKDDRKQFAEYFRIIAVINIEFIIQKHTANYFTTLSTDKSNKILISSDILVHKPTGYTPVSQTISQLSFLLFNEFLLYSSKTSKQFS